MCLRGIRPQDDLNGIARILKGKNDKDLYQWFCEVSEIISPVIEIVKKSKISFASFLKIHLQIAQNLCSTDETDGESRLWAKDTGEQLKLFIDELLLSADSLGEIKPSDYLGIFDSMMIGRKYRPKYGMHPRLFILSPMEARMQHYDLVILGGLNEGSWPFVINADPWMNRPMRIDAGLGLPEKRIGQSAHDFVQLFCAKEVVLTRSDKVDGTQSIVSRWLLRMEVVAKIIGASEMLKPDDKWFRWIELINAPEKIQAIEEPMPKPFIGARPSRLSVTNIEKLMRDPYSVYASKILKLKKLDDFDQDPGALEFGNFIHNSLDVFIKNYDDIVPQDRYAKLLEYGKDEFAKMNLSESVNYFWWPRFERIVKWFIENEEIQRIDKKEIYSEIKGEYKLEDGFVLYAKADRVEFDSEGNVEIVDYKTGTTPSYNDIELGFSPQITLEGLIALKGGFNKKANGVSRLAFWRLTGSNPPAKKKNYEKGLPELIEEADLGLKNLVEAFSNENTPYISCPDADFAPRYNDFVHLGRVKEWEGG